MENNEWKNYCISLIPKMKIRFKQMMGRESNLDNPQKITDKFEWLKAYDSNFLKTYCADKYTLRSYVKEKLNKDISIPLLGVYNNFDEINFSKLPKDYVIKTNHGSHTNIIVHNGQINKITAKKQFNEWLSKDWSWWGYEMHYTLIPRKIIIEPYMDNGKTGLIDYKFWCFNGKPKFFTINGDNGHGGINHYDFNGKLLNYSRLDYPADFSKKWNMPKNLNEMKKYAEILSNDFKFVRVDFYEINNKTYIGEMTFIPGAAYIKWKHNEDEELGKMLDL